MTRVGLAPLVDLQAGWARKAGELRTWTAMTVRGAVLIVTAVEGGFEGLADPPPGLWELTAVTSDPLESRQRAQEWCERKVVANGW